MECIYYIEQLLYAVAQTFVTGYFLHLGAKAFHINSCHKEHLDLTSFT